MACSIVLLHPSDLDGLIKAIERRIRETKTSNGTIPIYEKNPLNYCLKYISLNNLYENNLYDH